MLRCELLESRDCPALASAGGIVYGISDSTGAVEWSRALDPAFTGPLSVAGLADGDVLVGAGVGGGPRVIRLDGRSLREEWSVFVGDPNSRTGVSVADWQRVQSPLQAVSHATVPGATGAVQQALDEIPDSVAALLRDTGFRVVVYGGSGGLTSLPEFATLAGRPVGVPGVSGTWDSILSATIRNTTFTRQDQTSRAVRETGIGLWYRITEDQREEWRGIHAATDWESATLRQVPVEAFAEAFGWWVYAGRDFDGFYSQLLK